MLTGKDDYAYIQVFIDYLKEIIDMLLKLFRGSSDDTTTTTAPAVEENK